MTQTLQGNVYRALKSGDRNAPGVTIQIFQFTQHPPYPDTCRAQLIFNVRPGTYTAFWYEGEVRNLPTIIRSFAGSVDLWIPDGATADILRVPGMGALLELPGR